jgi:uncharacterized protein (UPF0335 family)
VASIAKFKQHSVGRLFQHNNRTAGDGVQHSNEMIDDAKTMFNYHLKRGSPEELDKRLSEIYIGRKASGVNAPTVLGELVVTLPSNVKPEDERAFFQATYDFFCNDFGEKNIINAVVHKDEVTPHLHLDFVPTVKEKEATTEREKAWLEKQGLPSDTPFERLCGKEAVTRKYLSTMHHRLSRYVKEQLQYEAAILNNATAEGNKTVLQMKLEKLRSEVEAMETQKKYLQKDILQIFSLAQANGVEKRDISLIPLLHKIDALEAENKILREVMTRNRYPYLRQDLEKMEQKKYVPARSTKLNVYDGSYAGREIEDNAILVFEFSHDRRKPSPQSAFISENSEAYIMSKAAYTVKRNVAIRSSRTSNKLYAFLKVDNAQETMNALLELGENLRFEELRGRKIYMERMQHDEYDFGRVVLEKLMQEQQVQVDYFERHDLQQKQKQEERKLEQTKA